MKKLYRCNICRRVMRVVAGNFQLDVPTQHGAADDLGVKLYAPFVSLDHEWRIEEDTAEVRVWNGVPDPVAVIDLDSVAVIRDKTCRECSIEHLGWDPMDTQARVTENPAEAADRDARWEAMLERARERKANEQAFARAAHRTGLRRPTGSRGTLR